MMQNSAAVLEIGFPETHARFWRISILNRNDPALPGLQAQLLTTPRHVTFRPETEQNYRLLYGNPRATPAQYDLARISNGAQWQTAPVAALGRGNEQYGLCQRGTLERTPSLAAVGGADLGSGRAGVDSHQCATPRQCGRGYR